MTWPFSRTTRLPSASSSGVSPIELAYRAPVAASNPNAVARFSAVLWRWMSDCTAALVTPAAACRNRKGAQA